MQDPFKTDVPTLRAKAKPEVKQHFHLIAGEVIFATAEGEPGTIRLNGVLQTQQKELRSHELGLSQQILQKHFFSKVGEVDATVMDVFIYGFTYLGFIFNSDFTKQHTTASDAVLN